MDVRFKALQFGNHLVVQPPFSDGIGQWDAYQVEGFCELDVRLDDGTCTAVQDSSGLHEFRLPWNSISGF